MNLESNLHILQYSEKGEMLRSIRVHNLVPSTALDRLRDYLTTNTAPAVPHHFCLGTGTTSPYSTDTTLQTTVLDISFTGSTVRSAGITFNGTVYSTDGVGYTFKEIGLFSSSSELWARALISSITKTSSNPTNEAISWSMDFAPAT